MSWKHWLFGSWKKADRVRQLVLQHAAQVQKTVDVYFAAVRAYFEDKDREKADKLALETHRAEGAADDTRRAVEREMIEGALLAPSRRSVLELIDLADRVANAAESTLDYLLTQNVKVPDSLVPLLLEIVSESETACQDIDGALRSFLAGKDGETTVCTDRIDACESRVDHLERRALVHLFGLDLDLAEKIHVRGLISEMVEISDRAEDLADRIVLASAERAF